MRSAVRLFVGAALGAALLAPRPGRAAPEDEAAPGALSTAETPSRAAIGSPWRPYEHFDSYSGETALHFVDVSIPGNGGLPIELHRSYRWSEGHLRDPGFQFKRTNRQHGALDAVQMLCLNPTTTALCVCKTAGTGCPTSVQSTGLGFDLLYPEPNPSTGLLKPGGQWRFAVAPEVEIQVFGSYFQSERKWSPGAKLPVTRNVDLAYVYGTLCGTGTSTYGGRAVELQVLARMASGTSQELARTGTGVWRSAGNWELRCVSGSPRLQLFAPGGVRYDLGQEVAATDVVGSARWLTTRATDLRTNAQYTVAYDTSDARFVRPTTVTGSDGRLLALAYETSADVSRTVPASLLPGWVAPHAVTRPVEPVLTSATAGTSVWRYTYHAPSSDAPMLVQASGAQPQPSVRRALATVQPAGVAGVWRFRYWPAWNPDIVEHRGSMIHGDQLLQMVIEPMGGQITYQLWSDAATRWQPARLSSEASWEIAYARWALACQSTLGQIDPNCQNLYFNLTNLYRASDLAARQQYRASMRHRAVSDPALELSGYYGSYLATDIAYTRATAAGQYDVTTLRSRTKATATTTVEILEESFHHIGDRYFAAVAHDGSMTAPAVTEDGWRIGELAQHVIRHPAATTARQVTTFQWDKRTFAPGTTYSRLINWHRDTAHFAPVLTRKQVTRYAANGNAAVISEAYADFTAYGSPQTITSEGPDPTSPDFRRQRVTTRTYHTDQARWLIDLPKSETTR